MIFSIIRHDAQGVRYLPYSYGDKPLEAEFVSQTSGLPFLPFASEDAAEAFYVEWMRHREERSLDMSAVQIWQYEIAFPADMRAYDPDEPAPEPEPEPEPPTMTLHREARSGGENVRADPPAGTVFVLFRMGDYSRTEKAAPYWLFGDRGAGAITGTVTAEAKDASGAVIATAEL